MELETSEAPRDMILAWVCMHVFLRLFSGRVGSRQCSVTGRRAQKFSRWGDCAQRDGGFGHLQGTQGHPRPLFLGPAPQSMLSASVSPAGEPLYGGALSAAMSLMDKACERRVVEGGMFLLGVILGGQVENCLARRASLRPCRTRARRCRSRHATSPRHASIPPSA
jgi:hypothetical protein